MISGINGTGGSMYLSQLRQVSTNLSGSSSLVNTTKAQYASKIRNVSLDAAFTKADTDGDGVISREEFDRVRSQAGGGLTGAMGGLNAGSTASLVSLLQSTNSVNATGDAANSRSTSESTNLKSDQVFGNLDSNGDGMVTRSEFENVFSAIQNAAMDQSTGTGSSSGTNPLAAQQKTAEAVAAQTKALMRQAINQYNRFAQAGTIGGAMSQYLLTG